jgi:hypothetical protein
MECYLMPKLYVSLGSEEEEAPLVMEEEEKKEEPLQPVASAQGWLCRPP